MYDSELTFVCCSNLPLNDQTNVSVITKGKWQKTCANIYLVQMTWHNIIASHLPCLQFHYKSHLGDECQWSFEVSALTISDMETEMRYPLRHCHSFIVTSLHLQVTKHDNNCCLSLLKWFLWCTLKGPVKSLC